LKSTVTGYQRSKCSSKLVAQRKSRAKYTGPPCIRMGRP